MDFARGQIFGDGSTGELLKRIHFSFDCPPVNLTTEARPLFISELYQVEIQRSLFGAGRHTRNLGAGIGFVNLTLRCVSHS